MADTLFDNETKLDPTKNDRIPTIYDRVSWRRHHPGIQGEHNHPEKGRYHPEMRGKGRRPRPHYHYHSNLSPFSSPTFFSVGVKSLDYTIVPQCRILRVVEVERARSYRPRIPRSSPLFCHNHHRRHQPPFFIDERIESCTDVWVRVHCYFI